MAKTKKPTKAKASVSSQQAKLTWHPKKTFELEFSIAWKEVKETYDKTIQELAKQATIKGFRQGKAPLKLVEQSIDKNKLYTEILNKLLPQTYSQAVNQHQLRPVCDPRLQPVKTKEGEDWVFKATACEAPDIDLGDYEKKIKAATAKEKIWVPGKEEKKKEKKDDDGRLKEIFNILLKEIKVELPDILVETEERRMLSRLLEQINKLGLTLDEYLASNKKTVEQLKHEHRHLAAETLSLEFILQAIAKEKNFTVEEKEIQQMIAAIPDEQSRENLKTPLQQAYIAAILRKRKVIDFLKNL